MSLTYKEQLSHSKTQNYVPAEIYVGKSSRGSDEIVGFMIPHIPGDPTYEKKKALVDKWASATTTPTTFKNEFSSGYSIIKQVRRNESDAVYWRVLHPEGFEFEISLSNFEYLMDNHVIDQGILVDSDHTNPAEFRLVLKRRNRKWLLVDASHPEYAKALPTIIPGSVEFKALEKAVRDEANSFNVELTIGDVVDLGGYSYGHHEYLGIYTLGYRQRGTDELNYVRKKIFKQVPKYNNDPVRYEVFSGSKKVTNIITTATHEVTVDEAMNEIKEVLKTMTYNGRKAIFDYHEAIPVGIWEKKPKKKDLTVKLERVPVSSFTGQTYYDIRSSTPFSLVSNAMIRHADGELYDVYQREPISYNYNTSGKLQCEYINQNNETVLLTLLDYIDHSRMFVSEFYDMKRAEGLASNNKTNASMQQKYKDAVARYDAVRVGQPSNGLHLDERVIELYYYTVE